MKKRLLWIPVMPSWMAMLWIASWYALSMLRARQELVDRVAEPDLIAVGRAAGVRMRALVDERAVRRVEILDPPVAVVVDEQPRVLARHRAAADDEARLAIATDDVLAVDERDAAADVGTRRMQVDETSLARRAASSLGRSDRTLQGSAFRHRDSRPSPVVSSVAPRYIP